MECFVLGFSKNAEFVLKRLAVDGFEPGIRFPNQAVFCDCPLC